MAKLNSLKISENDKLFDLERYNVKLKYIDISFIKAICGNPNPPRLV